MELNLANEVRRAIAFTDKNCKALGTFVYVFVSAKDPNGPDVVSAGQWVGCPRPSSLRSRAPRFAPLKALELMGFDLEPGKLVVTPVTGASSLNLMGGARYIGEHLDMTIGVSKLLDPHDLLLALSTLYASVFPDPIFGFHWGEGLYLHHAGFRYPSEEALQGALTVAQGTMLIRPASDHRRVYFATDLYYREHQYFPDGPKDSASHLDFVARDPVHFLHFVASAFGTAPTFWDTEPNSPIGVVWIKGDATHDPMGVMARSQWWIVEQKK